MRKNKIPPNKDPKGIPQALIVFYSVILSKV